MKGKTLTILRLLFGAGVIAYIATHWNQAWNLSNILSYITWQSTIVGTLLFMLFQFFVGLPWMWAELGEKARPLSLMVLSVATNFYNLVLPGRSGVLVRALYLKKNFQYEFKRYLAFCGILSWVGGLILVLSLLVVFFSGVMTKDNRDLRDLSLILGTALILVPIFSHFFSRSKEFKISYLSKSTLLIFASYALAQLFYVLRVAYYYYLATGSLDLRSSALIATITLSASIIQLLPGNLGVKEASFVFAGRLAGIDDPSLHLQIALLDRALTTFLLLGIGIPWHLFFTFGNSKLVISRKTLDAITQN